MISTDSPTVQAVVARGVQNSYTIPEDSEMGIAIHSGQVQMRGSKITAEEWKLEQEYNSDITPAVQLVKGKKHLQYANKEVIHQVCGFC